MEPLEPLVLKGKSEPLPAFRLLAARAASERRHETVFVGRERELALLRDAWARALTERRCELVTIVADAGLGKSRLAAEALASIEARVVRGRCLPYGVGITYWPVVEVLKQLDATALRSGRRGGDPFAAGGVGGGDVGGGDRLGVPQAARGAGAARRRLRRHPVGRGDVPRPGRAPRAALQRRPAPGRLHRPPGAARAPPLLAGDGAAGAAQQRGGGQPDRGGRAGGAAGEDRAPRPAATRSSSARCWRWPRRREPGSRCRRRLQALLAARLDQLDAAERRVLERGAVEGEIFHRGAVQALAPEETQVTPRLAALVRRELIRPDQAQFAREDGFRFRHLLIRDAAYDALPKATRAELHERFAAWLEQRGEELVELDEILGYHLEQAARYKQELGQADPTLAERAGERLAAAGRRALWRGDDRAAAGLLERALELTRPARLDVVLELDLAAALFRRDGAKAAAIADAAAERARAAGDETGELLARVGAAYHRSFFAADPAIDELERLARKALPLLEQAEDHAGLVHVWQALGYGVANFRGRFEDWAHASEQALRHARLAGQRNSHLFRLETALALGPRPADEALRTLDALLPENPHPRLLLRRAWLLTMLARFDEAARIAREAGER